MIASADRFTPLLARLRTGAWLSAALWALGAGLAVAGVLRLAGLPYASLAGAGAALAAGATLRLAGKAWRVDPPRLAAHLDRRFPELEESAALLLVEADDLPALARLQRARVAPRWATVTGAPGRWLPSLRPGLPLALGTLGLALFLSAPWWRAAFVDGPGRPVEDAARGAATADAPVPALLDITVRPPAYTGLAPYTVEDFDVTVPEGSEVSWALDWRGEGSLRLVLSDGAGVRFLPLEAGPEGAVQGATEVRRTSLYRLERFVGGAALPLPGVHTLSVTLDRPPRLRILEPAATEVEVPPAGPTTIAYRVEVEDDHGLGPVEVRASVAKGSGEGVKFRDEVFAFDHSDPLPSGRSFERTWRLPELGMEPGDEVYFFTVARDNRTPTPNESRSDTVVVRWLDEAPPAAVVEGLAIDVMPEAFMSQRQIIIETERLIADREALSDEALTTRARELGQAQADLKERYGQYLGDEFGEGGNPFALEAAEDEAGAAETHDDHDHEGHDHAGHGHDGDGADPIGESAPGPDTSGGAADLVARFAHEHGAADIGPITRRNPVGLMKRSLANMWEAELHLRLGDPETALPFEYEALKYLNLARQAERIYTRRLGFEPPPVTEERRLTGELDDIRSRERRQAARPDPDPHTLVRALYALLGAATPAQALDPDERELLRRAGRHFTALSQERPALIRHAATLERLAVLGRFETPDCADCLDTLRAATWTLLPPAEPGPDRGRRAPVDALGEAWLERLSAGEDGA